MSKALKSPPPVIRAHRPFSVCTFLLSAIVLTASPALAEDLRMDHENVTVEPIEDRDEPSEASEEVPQGVFEPVYEDKAPAMSAEPAVHEMKPEGPEIDPQPASAPASEPFFPSQPGQTASEAAPEPAGIDPLMEAVQAHDQAHEPDEASGSDAVRTEAEAAEATPAAARPAARAATPKAAKTGAKPVEVAAVAPDDKVDIFDQWAHSKFEARTEKAPHPLAAQHPDEFVVVCEAGCAGSSAEIVYMERRDARGPVNEKPMKAGLIASTSSIDCVGGCYLGHNAYGAVAVTWDPSAMVTESASDDNGWMTTVRKAAPAATAKNKAGSSGRWYDRIN